MALSRELKGPRDGDFIMISGALFYCYEKIVRFNAMITRIKHRRFGTCPLEGS